MSKRMASNSSICFTILRRICRSATEELGKVRRRWSSRATKGDRRCRRLVVERRRRRAGVSGPVSRRQDDQPRKTDRIGEKAAQAARGLVRWQPASFHAIRAGQVGGEGTEKHVGASEGLARHARSRRRPNSSPSSFRRLLFASRTTIDSLADFCPARSGQHRH